MKYKIYLNRTYEIVSATSREEAIRKAVEIYINVHSEIPGIIEIEGVEVVK